MALYRTRPEFQTQRTCEAEQFGGFYATPYPPGVEMEDNSNDPDPTKERYRFYVPNPHLGGREYIAPGDYVVRHHDGSGYFVCGAALFEATYEKVE